MLVHQAPPVINKVLCGILSSRLDAPIVYDISSKVESLQGDCSLSPRFRRRILLLKRRVSYSKVEFHSKSLLGFRPFQFRRAACQMSDRSSSPGDPPEPYAPNSDVSAASSPLLPFGNKKLQEDDQEDQQWTSGGGDPSGGSPDYTGVASGEKSAPRFGSNLNDDSAAQGQADENGQPGPSRKRPRLDDSNSSSHQTSAQQVAPAIPFPHQLPLPDHSKSIYLSGLDELARTRGAALKPYHPVPRVIMNSLFGFTPRNEVSKEVGEWLMMTCANLPGHVEVSARSFKSSRGSG